MVRAARIAAFAAAACLGLAACDRQERVASRAERAVAEYKTNPSKASEQAAENALAAVEAEIASLDNAGEAQKAASLRSIYQNLSSDFRSARLANAIESARGAMQDVGESVKEAGQSIGEAFRDAFSAPGTPAAPDASPEGR